MIKQVQVGKRYLMVGGNFKSFHLGLTIDKWGFSLNFGFFWIGLEL